VCLDPRHSYLFAESFVWHTKHSGLVHGWMIVNRPLNLGAVNILSSAQNHVLYAILDIDKTVLIETTDVTRTQPTINDCLGGCISVVPVTSNQHWTEKPNLAATSSRHRL